MLPIQRSIQLQSIPEHPNLPEPLYPQFTFPEQVTVVIDPLSEKIRSSENLTPYGVLIHRNWSVGVSYTAMNLLFGTVLVVGALATLAISNSPPAGLRECCFTATAVGLVSMTIGLVRSCLYVHA